jgi:uncharacterized protein YdiU (UPF0061 family)
VHNQIQNTYTQLPKDFFSPCAPKPVTDPKTLFFNDKLAKDLGFSDSNPETRAEFFSGNRLLPQSEPVALAYAGHQFGHFVPSLGDGRAVLLGNVVDKAGKRFDIQLKGSGQTPFSRGGDGRAALGPMLREYIVSEAMHALGVSSTRALALISTGEPVVRETFLPGAILTRVASSHLRVGTFEYFACRDDFKNLKILAEYAIERHFPGSFEQKSPYLAFLRNVMDRQTTTISHWMSKGFIHGVMNTDNSSISGETIDYGPCAFMDEYRTAKVFSSIDRNGRYAFSQQPAMGLWNFLMLCQSIAFLLNRDFAKSQNEILHIGSEFSEMLGKKQKERMCLKLGLDAKNSQDIAIMESLFQIMEEKSLDFTLTFSYLESYLASESSKLEKEFLNIESLKEWIETWKTRLDESGKTIEETLKTMAAENPKVIPRNHRIAEAIESATNRNDLTKAQSLLETLLNPYDPKLKDSEFRIPPKHEERVLKTFCGT